MLCQGSPPGDHRRGERAEPREQTFPFLPIQFLGLGSAFQRDSSVSSWLHLPQAAESHMGACFLCHPELKGPYPISETNINRLSLGHPWWLLHKNTVLRQWPAAPGGCARSCFRLSKTPTTDKTPRFNYLTKISSSFEADLKKRRLNQGMAVHAFNLSSPQAEAGRSLEKAS